MGSSELQRRRYGKLLKDRRAPGSFHILAMVCESFVVIVPAY